MSWSKGKQKERIEFSSNDLYEHLSSIEGTMTEEEAKYELYRFLRCNIAYTAELFLGIKLFPFQALAIKGMFVADYSMMVFSRGLGKSWNTAIYILLECMLNPKAMIGVLSGSFRQCLSSESILPTNLGFTRIKDLKVGSFVQSIEGSNRILDKWENQPSPLLKITTRRGFSLEGKLDHKVFCYNPETMAHEWVLLKDLVLGSFLAVQRGKNLWGSRTIDADLAYLYGLGLEDGSVEKIKKISQGILEADSISIGHFLSGLFDADGYCSKAEATLCTSSLDVAEKVQLLLLNYGIISKLCYEKARGNMVICGNKCIGRASYKVRITGKQNLLLFREKIGFRLSRKKKNLDGLIESSTQSCIDVVPNLSKVLWDEKRKSARQPLVRKCYKGLTYNKINALVETDPEENADLQYFLDHNFYYDEVVSIEETEGITYDITVEKEHCYNAQGFLNHNSKLIFQTIEKIIAKPEAKLARDCGFKITKGTDMWTLVMGGGQAIALPLANGERLRGFRFNRVILDEFITIPEKIFTEVVTPFLGVIQNPVEREEMENLEEQLINRGDMEVEEKYVWPNNKLIILSSPSFKFEYMYKLFKQYEALIFGEDISQSEDYREDVLTDDAYRLIMQLSYDCAPRTLYDKNLLAQAKATMSEMQFQREFGAQFVDESDGYFRLSKMMACTIQEGDFPSVEIIGEPKEEYVVSFDPNWAGNSSADHFAMHVFKLDRESKKGCLVHSYAIAGVDLKEHMFYFYYLLTHFNIVGICGDYNGGVQFIQACNESELFKKSQILIQTIEVPFDDPVEYQTDLLSFKSQYNASAKKYCILRKPSATWIRVGNEMLQAAIDHKKILFASRAVFGHFDEQRKKHIPIEELKWDIGLPKMSAATAMIEFIDHQKNTIELTKSECANIEVTSNPQGSQSFGLPQMFKRQKGPNRARKDSYSALVLGNWFMKILFDSDDVKEEKKEFNTFTPFAI